MAWVGDADPGNFFAGSCLRRATRASFHVFSGVVGFERWAGKRCELPAAGSVGNLHVDARSCCGGRNGELVTSTVGLVSRPLHGGVLGWRGSGAVRVVDASTRAQRSSPLGVFPSVLVAVSATT